MNWFGRLWSGSVQSDPPSPSPSLLIASDVTSMTNTVRMPTPQGRVVLNPVDGGEVYLAKEDLTHLKSIDRMAQDLGILRGEEVVINVPISLTADQMKNVIEWCHSRRDRPSDAIGLSIMRVFPKMTVLEIVNLIDVALFLDMGELADALGARAAALLRDMDTETARKALGRENMPPPTEEQIRKTEALKKWIGK